MLTSGFDNWISTKTKIPFCQAQIIFCQVQMNSFYTKQTLQTDFTRRKAQKLQLCIFEHKLKSKQLLKSIKLGWFVERILPNHQTKCLTWQKCMILQTFYPNLPFQQLWQNAMWCTLMFVLYFIISVFFVFYIVSSIPHPPPSDPIPYHRIHLYLYNVDSIFSFIFSIFFSKIFPIFLSNFGKAGCNEVQSATRCTPPPLKRLRLSLTLSPVFKC